MLSKVCIFKCPVVIFYGYMLGPFDLSCHLTAVFLFLILPDDLSIDESEVLELPTVTVLDLICGFKSNSVSFMELAAPVFAVAVLEIVVHHCWTLPFKPYFVRH